MRIDLQSSNLSKSVLEVAQEHTNTGKISISLYGSYADNFINGKEKLPYIKKDGIMQWNISIREATLYDLGQTFCLNVGNHPEIEFEEVQNWGTFEPDLKVLDDVFGKYLKSAIKGWRPKKKAIQIKELVKFVRWTHTDPRFVMDAIWLREFYTLQEFSSLFMVGRRRAKRILESAGYLKKDTDDTYNLIPQRRESVRDCLEKAESACQALGYKAAWNVKWKNWRYKKIIGIGEAIAGFGKQKEFFTNIMSDWEEPAYSKRQGQGEKILIVIFTIAMALFVGLVVLAFIYHVSTNAMEGGSGIYGFWGSIAGSMIAGLITIFTTYLIIQRGYKVDYHQERMAALPFFEMNVVARNFSTQTGELPNHVKEIINRNACFSSELFDDEMLIEIVNIGNGTAFQTVMEGLTPFYEEPSYQSISLGKKKYMIVRNRNSGACKLKYYDIYGNYYYQEFHFAVDYSQKDLLEVGTKPPELILRTNRIRYIQ